MILDAAASRVRILTFAEGLFAKFAHDLDIRCTGLTGTLDETRATIEAPIAGIEVVGAIVKGEVDTKTLSPNDRRDILEKMRRDVFRAEPHASLRVEATREEVRLVVPNGPAWVCVMRPTIERTDHRLTASGTFEVSMAAIGATSVKGPMGAFRVRDRVRVEFEVAFDAAT